MITIITRPSLYATHKSFSDLSLSRCGQLVSDTSQSHNLCFYALFSVSPFFRHILPEILWQQVVKNHFAQPQSRRVLVVPLGFWSCAYYVHVDMERILTCFVRWSVLFGPSALHISVRRGREVGLVGFGTWTFPGLLSACTATEKCLRPGFFRHLISVMFMLYQLRVL